MLEHIMLKPPSFTLYAAYIQTVCLAKDVFVNPADIRALSWLHYADIRRLLLSLQFWVDSNADACYKRGEAVGNYIECKTTLSAKETICASNELVIDRNSSLEQHRNGQLVANCSPTSVSPVANKLDKCDFRVVTSCASYRDKVSNTDKTNAADIEQLRQKNRHFSSEIPKKLESVKGTSNGCDEIANQRIHYRATSLDQNKDANANENSNLFAKQNSSQNNDDAETSTSEEVSRAEVRIDFVKLDQVCVASDESPSDKSPSHEDVSLTKDQEAQTTMHEFCLESLLGLRNINVDAKNVLATLKSKVSSLIFILVCS